MIQTALQFTRSILDQYLKNRFGSDSGLAVLNGVVESSGDIPQLNQNKVVISLINIQRETLKPFNVRAERVQNGDFAFMSPSEKYNLDLLVTSQFDDYTETLKFLDAIIYFFQVHPSIDGNSFGNLPAAIGKLEFELETLDFHAMHSLWNAMGAKYQPSLVYRTRLLNVPSEQLLAFRSDVKRTSNTVAL